MQIIKKYIFLTTFVWIFSSPGNNCRKDSAIFTTNLDKRYRSVSASCSVYNWSDSRLVEVTAGGVGGRENADDKWTSCSWDKHTEEQPSPLRESHVTVKGNEAEQLSISGGSTVKVKLIYMNKNADTWKRKCNKVRWILDFSSYLSFALAAAQTNSLPVIFNDPSDTWVFFFGGGNFNAYLSSFVLLLLKYSWTPWTSQVFLPPSSLMHWHVWSFWSWRVGFETFWVFPLFIYC